MSSLSADLLALLISGYHENKWAIRNELDHGANPNWVHPVSGVSAMHLASGQGEDATHLMLLHGGDPNVLSSEGMSPLHVAASWGDWKTVHLLLKSGANVNIQDHDGNTAYCLAVEEGNDDCARLLKQHAQMFMERNNTTCYKQKTEARDHIPEWKDYYQNTACVLGASKDVTSHTDTTSVENEVLTPQQSDTITKKIFMYLQEGKQISFDVTSPDTPLLGLKPVHAPTVDCTCLSQPALSLSLSNLTPSLSSKCHTLQEKECNLHSRNCQSPDNSYLKTSVSRFQTPASTDPVIKSPMFQRHGSRVSRVSPQIRQSSFISRHPDNKQDSQCSSTDISPFSVTNSDPNRNFSLSSTRRRLKKEFEEQDLKSDINGEFRPEIHFGRMSMEHPKESSASDYFSATASVIQVSPKIKDETEASSEMYNTDMFISGRVSETSKANENLFQNLLNETCSNDKITDYVLEVKDSCTPEVSENNHRSERLLVNETFHTDKNTSLAWTVRKDSQPKVQNKPRRKSILKPPEIAALLPKSQISRNQRVAEFILSVQDFISKDNTEDSNCDGLICRLSPGNTAFEESAKHTGHIEESLYQPEKVSVEHNDLPVETVQGISNVSDSSFDTFATCDDGTTNVAINVGPIPKTEEKSKVKDTHFSVKEIPTAASFTFSNLEKSDKNHSPTKWKPPTSVIIDDDLMTSDDSFIQRVHSDTLKVKPQFVNFSVNTQPVQMLEHLASGKPAMVSLHQETKTQGTTRSTADVSISEKPKIESDSLKWKSHTLVHSDNGFVMSNDGYNHKTRSRIYKMKVKPKFKSPVVGAQTTDKHNHLVLAKLPLDPIVAKTDNQDCRRLSNDSLFSTISVKEYVHRDKKSGITLIEKHIPSYCGSSIGRRSLDSTSSRTTIDSQATLIYDWRALNEILKVKHKKESALLKAPVGYHSMKEIPISVSNDTCPQKCKESLENSTEELSLCENIQSTCSDDDETTGAEVIPPHLEKLTCQEISQELKKYGEIPGPVIAATKQVYLKRLATLESHPGLVVLSRTSQDYPDEMRQALNGKFDSSGLAELESVMVETFSKPKSGHQWREGTMKSSFTYLLLDPRITLNLPMRAKDISDLETFKTFICAIFYIGKGKRSRPYSHLYETVSKMNRTNVKLSAKEKQITDIWNAGFGVVSLPCFQSVIPVEAYTREACMIEAVGLHKLTNIKQGDFYGAASAWSVNKRRKFGVYLLKKALQIFLAEGERQICVPDLKNSQ